MGVESVKKLYDSEGNFLMGAEEYEDVIRPFFWVEHATSVSCCLDMNNCKGNGCELGRMAHDFLHSKICKDIYGIVFDCELGFFSAISKDEEDLRKFIWLFKEELSNRQMIR